MLIVNCVSFLLENNLHLFPVVFNKSLKLLQILWPSGMNLLLQFTPQIFNGIEVRALCRTVSNVHFGLLEVVLHLERCMFWVIVMLKENQQPRTGFAADCLNFYFQIFTYPFSFIIPSTLMRFPGSGALKCPHSIIFPPLCFTVGIVFFGL